MSSKDFVIGGRLTFQSIFLVVGVSQRYQLEEYMFPGREKKSLFLQLKLLKIGDNRVFAIFGFRRFGVDLASIWRRCGVKPKKLKSRTP